MYRLDYQFNHDIDWFCLINGAPVHFASNGGILPGRSYSIKNLIKLQHQISNLEQSFRCSVNVEYIERYLREGEYYADLYNASEEEFRQLLPESFEITNDVAELPRHLLVYGWSFIEMAKRGFISFDRNKDENTYHLVAWPADYDFERFDGNVYESLKEYNLCCFPPFHEDYVGNVPECIRFDVRSCKAFPFHY